MGHHENKWLNEYTSNKPNAYTGDSFKIIDKANHKTDLKIKEALNINWSKPILNTQVNHYNITLSI